MRNWIDKPADQLAAQTKVLVVHPGSYALHSRKQARVGKVSLTD
jgi:hypothetical protein